MFFFSRSLKVHFLQQLSPVIVHDCVEPVSDGEHGAFCEFLPEQSFLAIVIVTLVSNQPNRLLNECIGAHIDGCSGLVQNEHFRLPK